MSQPLTFFIFIRTYRKDTRSLQAKDNEEKVKYISKTQEINKKHGQKKTIKPTWPQQFLD